jgi:hypothetical protein
MYREDEENTAFITVDGLFCYVSMPYNLKNALTTFVCAMHKTFGDPIRDLVEVYVDNIVVKVKSSVSLLDNLALVFDRLRLTRTKLNLEKYVFEVTAGKLLGFLVSCRGIEANPEKIRTIEAMWPPTRIKDVQKLMICLAVLSRFISRLAEWALPFFKLLWKFKPFIWSNDTEEAFQELKRYLTSPPVMVAPEPSEPLLLYIVATLEAVSMVLVAERPDPHGLHEFGSSSVDGSRSQDPGPTEESGAADGSGSQDPGPTEEPGVDMAAGSQSPEAFMGTLDQGVTGSPGLELLPGAKGRELPGPAPLKMDASDPPGGPGLSNVRCTSSVRSSTKSRQGTLRFTSCFMQSSSPPGIYATTSRLTGSQWWLHNPNVTGNIAKWAAELAEFELDFVPHLVVKSQVLADFIVDWIPSASPQEARMIMRQSSGLH